MRLVPALLLGLCGTAAAQPVTHPDEIRAPGCVERVDRPPPPPAAIAPPPAVDAAPRWLVLGAITDEHGALYGARATVDLLASAGWSLGIAAAYRATATSTDASARSNVVAYLARTMAVGPLFLRLSIGAGEAFVDGGSGQMSIGGASTSPIGEGSFLIGIPVGTQWLITGGPVVDVAIPSDTNTTTTHEITLLAGVGRRF